MQYTTGTVAVTNGSAIVTGSGTLFLTNASIGDIFTIQDEGVWYQIASVDTDLQVTLTANYAGTTDSGLGYAITSDFSPSRGYPLLNPRDVETASLVARAVQGIDTDMQNAFDLMSGLTTHNIAADADYTLTAIQARNAALRITDTTPLWSTGRNIILPNTVRQWTVINDALQIATFKTATGGGVPVAPLKTAIIFVDGTNAIRVTDDS